MLLPRQRSKLAKGAKDEWHALSQTLYGSVTVIGIDIAKTRSTWSVRMRGMQSCCGRSGRAVRSKHDAVPDRGGIVASAKECEKFSGKGRLRR